MSKRGSEEVSKLVEMLCKSIVIERSLDLPTLSENVGLNWFEEALPALAESEELKELLAQSLQRLKHILVNGLLQVAMTGKERHKPGPDASAVKAMVAWIDSGVATGTNKNTTATGESSNGVMDADMLKTLLG